MKRVSINDVSDTAEIIENTLFFQRRTFLKDVFFMNPGAMKKAAFEQYIGHGDFALCSNLILGINRSISVVLLFVLAAYKNHNEEKKARIPAQYAAVRRPGMR